MSGSKSPVAGRGKRTAKHHLAQGIGDIEASAHVVLLLYTPMQNDVATGQDEITIGKNRHGSMGAIPVRFDRAKLKFFARQEIS